MHCQTDEQSTELENGSLSVKVHDTCKKLVMFWYGFKSILSLLKITVCFSHPSPRRVHTRARAVNGDGDFVKYFYQSASPHRSSPRGKPTPDNENGAWPHCQRGILAYGWFIGWQACPTFKGFLIMYRTITWANLFLLQGAVAFNSQQSSAPLHLFPKNRDFMT